MLSVCRTNSALHGICQIFNKDTKTLVFGLIYFLANDNHRKSVPNLFKVLRHLRREEYDGQTDFITTFKVEYSTTDSGPRFESHSGQLHFLPYC